MKTKVWVFLGVLLIYLFLSYLSIFMFSVETVRLMTKEDHFYENLGALSALSASVIFFILFFKDKSGNDFYFFKTRKNVFFLMLALLLFFGFGEEISWGQRIFNWQTPALWWQMNFQHETNIHNLTLFHNLDATGSRKTFWAELLDMNRMFSLFWLVYFFVFPILNQTISRFSDWVRRVNIPLVPIWMAVLYPLNYLVSKIIQLYLANGSYAPQVEIKEAYYEVLFTATGIWFLTEFYKHSKNRT